MHALFYYDELHDSIFKGLLIDFNAILYRKVQKTLGVVLKEVNHAEMLID